MTGPLSTPLSAKLAERRAQQLGELESLTQQQLNEHERALQQRLSDARHTTETAIRDQNQRLITALSEAETRQWQQIENIEQRLATATKHAERLSQIGGLRSWMRPLAITAAVMIAVGSLTAGGLAVTDRVIDKRLERLAELNDEAQQAKNQPRLPEGVKIEVIGGHTYLVGVDSNQAFIGTLNDGQTPVIGLTRSKED